VCDSGAGDHAVLRLSDTGAVSRDHAWINTRRFRRALVNERMFQAGDRLRLDWELAGLTMMARSQVEAGRVEVSAVHFSDKRLAARERVQHAMVVLGPTRNIVVDCCVFGEPARRYVEVLRLGLRTLANHYGMP